MTLELPFVLLLLLVPIVLALIGIGKKKSSIQFSTLEILKSVQPHRPSFSAWLLNGLRYSAFALFVIALARPQLVDTSREFLTEGIDITIALDISGSMQAEDFQPENRLAVAKQEARKFILGRQNDRIGLVVFAQQSFTQCPLTLDYNVLLKLLDEVHIGLIQDGTAIGLAIANSINRLRDSHAKSKVIILITDGANNSGKIDPITAAELAKKFKIKIYTIGVGREGLVPFPIDDPVFGRRYVQARVDIGEDTLKKIAAITGGLFFRARDEKALAEIYKTIDSLEKTKIEVKEYMNKEEIYPVFLIPGVLILAFEVILRNTLFLKIP